MSSLRARKSNARSPKTRQTDQTTRRRRAQVRVDNRIPSTRYADNLGPTSLSVQSHQHENMEASPFLPDSKLNLRDKGGCNRAFTIVKVLEPFTRGQAIAVRSDTDPGQSLLVKIFDPRYFYERFDRRYSNYVECPWTLEAEASAVVDPEALLRGTGYLVPQELEEDEPPADSPRAHRAARWEKHFQRKMRLIYEKELAAYKRCGAIRSSI